MGKADNMSWLNFGVFILLQSSLPALSSNISTTVELNFNEEHQHEWPSQLITASNLNATSSSRNESEIMDSEELPIPEFSATFQVNFAAKAASIMATVSLEADSDNTTRY